MSLGIEQYYLATEAKLFDGFRNKLRLLFGKIIPKPNFSDTVQKFNPSELKTELTKVFESASKPDTFRVVLVLVNSENATEVFYKVLQEKSQGAIPSHLMLYGVGSGLHHQPGLPPWLRVFTLNADDAADNERVATALSRDIFERYRVHRPDATWEESKRNRTHPERPADFSSFTPSAGVPTVASPSNIPPKQGKEVDIPPFDILSQDVKKPEPAPFFSPIAPVETSGQSIVPPFIEDTETPPHQPITQRIVKSKPIPPSVSPPPMTEPSTSRPVTTPPPQEPEDNTPSIVVKSRRASALPQPENTSTKEKAKETPIAQPLIYGYVPADANGLYFYGEETKESFIGTEGWVLAAASRRGNSHREKGSFREDAFAMRSVGNWHFLAVSDGAGSAKLSREAAKRAVDTAIDTLSDHARRRHKPEATEQAMRDAMVDAVRTVHTTVSKFTQSQGLTPQDTYATLLMLAHRPNPDGTSTFGVFQVGDGVMFGLGAMASNILFKGDHGDDTSSTQFILSFSADELVRRVAVHTSKAPMHAFVLMTDGIEDDLRPSPEEHAAGTHFEHKLHQYTQQLRELVLAWPFVKDWGTLLLDQISYSMVGSRDDRTLAILTQPAHPIETTGGGA